MISSTIASSRYLKLINNPEPFEIFVVTVAPNDGLVKPVIEHFAGSNFFYAGKGSFALSFNERKTYIVV